MAKFQTFDANKLVREVEMLLVQHGLDPEPVEGMYLEQVIGASKLLRGFGITPAMKPEDGGLDLDGHARYNRIVHGD